jgi:hypothetical protein
LSNTDEEAIRIIEDKRRSAKSGKSVANKHQLPRSEQELMAKVLKFI